MGSAQTIAQQQIVLIAIVAILIFIAINQIFIYYQFLIRLKHEARSSAEINIEAPQFPAGIIGLLLLGVGLGLAHANMRALSGAGAPVFVLTGLLFSAFALARWCLDNNDEDDESCD